MIDATVAETKSNTDILKIFVFHIILYYYNNIIIYSTVLKSKVKMLESYYSLIL